MTALLVVAAVAVAAWVVLRLAARGDIRGPEARRLVADGARLVDVRTPSEFALRHLPGAINVPLDTLDQRLQDVGPPERPIVVYCASGARSAVARRVLQRHGFQTVRNLGGIGAW